MTENIDNSAAQEEVPEDIQEDKTEKSEVDEKKKKNLLWIRSSFFC